MEEIVITEAEIPKFLYKYQLQSKELARKGEYSASLESLSQSEDLLEAVSKEKISADTSYLICTLHNSAYCYYKLENYPRAAAFLETTLSNIELSELSHPLLQKHKQFKDLKVKCALKLQLSGLLAKLERHEAALAQARSALELVYVLIELTLQSCNEHLERHSKIHNVRLLRNRIQSHKQYNLIASPHYLHCHEMVTQSQPFLSCLNKRLRLKERRGRVELKEKLELQPDEWVDSLTVERVLELHWLSPEDLNGTGGVQTEITVRGLVEKLAFVMVALLLIGDAMKATASPLSTLNEYYVQAFELGLDFLPCQSRLVKSIGSLLHSSCKHVIAKPGIIRKGLQPKRKSLSPGHAKQGSGGFLSKQTGNKRRNSLGHSSKMPAQRRHRQSGDISSSLSYSASGRGKRLKTEEATESTVMSLNWQHSNS